MSSTRPLRFVPDGPGELGPSLEVLCRGPWSVAGPEVVEVEGEGPQDRGLAVRWELPAPGHVDLALEAAIYWEVRELVWRFAELTSKAAIEVEVEYADEGIGSIAAGSVEAGISEGLLGEWARELAARGAP